jgi:hypothetical protein
MSAVTGNPLGWRGAGGSLMARMGGSCSDHVTFTALGVPVMLITPTVGLPRLQVTGCKQSALL